MASPKKSGSRVLEAKPDGGEKVSEKVKRVYRLALDTSKRLDEILKQKKAYRDVFLPDAVMLRSRLQDICERIMFYDPLECGRKAEELLWRKVYYDVIQLMKHNRKQMRPSSSLESAFRTHLSAAMGYYHHLLFKLQHEYRLQLACVMDFFCVPEPRTHRKTGQSKKNVDVKITEWAIKACHRCLVCLGDLARYQQEYDEGRSPAVAQRYYWQAFTLCPVIGMPHNQLGTLAGSRHYNIDAVYHYLRCLISPVSFEGAHDNLMRLFEKNQKKYQELAIISPRDHHPDHLRAKDVKRFCIRFMHLLKIFMVHWESHDQAELQECCQTTLQDFNLCMFYQPPHVTNPEDYQEDRYSEEKPHYLDGELVFKLTASCMMVVYLMQKQGDKDVTAAIAFSLAFFSHMLNHTVMRLQAALYELENPRKPLQVDDETDIVKPVPEVNQGAVLNGNCEQLSDVGRSSASSMGSPEQTEQKSQEEDRVDKTRRRRKMMKRRKRRRGSDASSDSEKHASSDGESDLSEGEEHVDLSASESEDEESTFLNVSDSSDSDSDDNLMVSQELRPGFSLVQEGSADIMKTPVGIEVPSITDSVSSQPQEGTLNEYIQNFSIDSLLDSSNFLQNTLRLGIPFISSKENESECDPYRDVVQGKRDVRVPPGFETASEAHHVKEITEKLNNFVIETDTSDFPTDTDNSSIPTESELETDAESVIDKEELEARKLQRLIQICTNETLLPAVKVFCDWMRCHPQIITSTAQSSHALWSRLSVLLNFLPQEGDLANPELCPEEVLPLVASCCHQCPAFLSSPPLSEDLHFQKFSAMAEVHKQLNMTTDSRPDFSRDEEAFLRICWLRKFGYFLQTVPGVSFEYDTEKGHFYGPYDLQSQPEDKVSPDRMGDLEARRNQLMRDMAQLRLQDEVSQLEGSLQAREQPSLPPYLVPDASALIAGLTSLKQLVISARFIVIIPIAVIDHLDQLKRESIGAREAIRWLEAEFRKGNRYLRAQKHHERLGNAPQRNLKKKDVEAWRFFQMIDCAKYLGQQSTGSPSMVAILTSNTNQGSGVSTRLQQAVATAQQEGLTIYTVQEFHNKWKEASNHGNGGKT